MKKLSIVLLLGIAFLLFSSPAYTQIKSKENSEKKEIVQKKGKQLNEDGSVKRPNKEGKQFNKDGGVTKPKDHLSTPKLNKGSASLIFFYFGDSPFETLFQESMELYRAMDDYQKVVLLKEDSYGGVKLSQRAMNKADIVAMPTRENLIKYFKELTKGGYYIDVWIFSHGSPSGIRVYDSNANDHNGNFTNNEILDLPESTGYKFIPIRMVYQGNCYGFDLVDEWRAIGAKTALGSRQVAFVPYEFSRFASQWNKGKTFRVCRDYADSKTPHGPAYDFVAITWTANAKSNNYWDGCPSGYNILGTSEKALDCAQEFFSIKEMFGGQELEWRSNGESTMNYSNFKKVAGNYDLRKSTVPKWD